MLRFGRLIIVKSIDLVDDMLTVKDLQALQKCLPGKINLLYI